MDLASFKNLLERLQSPDHDIRTEAENTLGSIPATDRLSLFLQSMTDTTLAPVPRTLSAVLCRRLLMGDCEEAFGPLPEETKNGIRQQLLVSIVNEPVELMRRKIADVAAELVREHFGDDNVCQWTEFQPFIFECFKSSDPGLREVACHLFAIVPAVFGPDPTPLMPDIGHMLNQALHDASPNVREAGFRALSAFLVQNSTENSIQHALKDLVEPALMAVAANLESDPEDDTMLKCLAEMADAAPKYLRPFLLPTLELCYKVLCNNDLADPIRHIALEVIVTLSENIPSSVRKAGKDMIKPLVRTLLQMMTELEEDPDWATADSPEEDEEDSNAITAEMALDRFACAMGSQAVLDEITQTVPVMLQDHDWKKRHAGLMAVSACGEGCHKQMEGMLGSIIQAVVPRMADPHPRVRYAACNAIGQMAADFGPKLHKNYHSAIIPAILHVLDDEVPRVQANAGAALVNCCETSHKGMLIQYLDDLVKKLEEVMTAKFQEMVEKGHKLVLLQTVTSIAAVADAAGENFAPYYDRFMPGLKYIMENAVHPDLRLLRGKTIECISLIVLAVGKEKFMQDASSIMSLFMKTQVGTAAEGTGDASADEQFDDDDPQVNYIITAWARICKLLGRSFEPFLPMVMPQVLRTARMAPKVCVLDNEEAESFDPESWQILSIGEDQNCAIRTSILEDKATACQMLVCYARELKESFAPYCEDVLNTMLPMLNLCLNDEIRSAASEIMPYLMDSMKKTRPDIVASAWDKVFTKLMEAISTEPERDLVADHLEALASCIERLGVGYLNYERMTEIHRLLDRFFHEHFEKDEERAAKRQDEDYDEQEEERILNEKDEDEYVLSKMCEVMRAIFSTYKTDALPLFQQLMVHVVKLLEPNRPWSDMQWGLCFCADLIEHAGPQSFSMKDFFIPAFARAIMHRQNDIRQMAIYGIGVMAMYGGPDYTATLTDFVPPLMQIIESPDSASDENNLCRENAVSSMTKIMKYRTECLIPAGLTDLNALIVRWLTWLPIWEDGEETDHVYGYLCDLVEANNPAVLGGPTNTNLPRIVAAIARVFSEKSLFRPDEEEGSASASAASGAGDKQVNGAKSTPGTPSVYDRCVSILRLIQANSVVYEACMAQLPEKEKQAVIECLS
ncbi:importin 5 [Echinococcus multilocularis]|uniref:Importin 5 n=1 Tax=Echinococcus multilocularis TaxID=6211 RepID=A0A087VXA0_ECHMU|nr:importin 5 [Echinococcus multilocularis]